MIYYVKLLGSTVGSHFVCIKFLLLSLVSCGFGENSCKILPHLCRLPVLGRTCHLMGQGGQEVAPGEVVLEAETANQGLTRKLL